MELITRQQPGSAIHYGLHLCCSVVGMQNSAHVLKRSQQCWHCLLVADVKQAGCWTGPESVYGSNACKFDRLDVIGDTCQCSRVCATHAACHMMCCSRGGAGPMAFMLWLDLVF
jgi:hypothetical protein